MDLSEASIDELSDILRSSYELVVTDAVVFQSVNDLSNSIEGLTTAIVATKATPKRLADLLGIPESDDDETDTEQED